MSSLSLRPPLPRSPHRGLRVRQPRLPDAICYQSHERHTEQRQMLNANYFSSLYVFIIRSKLWRRSRGRHNYCREPVSNRGTSAKKGQSRGQKSVSLSVAARKGCAAASRVTLVTTLALERRVNVCCRGGGEESAYHSALTITSDCYHRRRYQLLK
ncbi:hypothetical protein E2C01_032708 [Portunus trituberculatus]|uniref:Uncharacterized protein n=1 Tax=Portunus trituberculatus TaxID=210409 RepID=A0A5B7F247_PORTR|nr:hypothetical protein [Portunus trituberculatus]